MTPTAPLPPLPGYSVPPREVVPRGPGSLTSELDDPHSPLRHHLQVSFPHRSGILKAYRDGAGPIVVEQTGANLGTIGTAFEILTDFTLDPGHTPELAVHPFLKRGGADTVAHLIGFAHAHAGEHTDLEVLTRASWALALCVEVFRAGLFPDSPLDRLRRAKSFDVQSLLELASDDVVAELSALQALALTRLHPRLSQSGVNRSLHLGPTFAASTLCAADADLICDGLLLDVKTRLGSWRSGAADRYTSVSLLEIYQLLGYALFDTDDEYRIDAVGWYAARYGYLATWPLQAFVDELAGAHVDLPSARAQVRDVLTAQRDAAHPKG